VKHTRERRGACRKKKKKKRERYNFEGNANKGVYYLCGSLKRRMGVWTELMWLRTGTSGSPL
jgi:hypothetical protein